RHKPQCRAGARHHCATRAACPRRRCDRVTKREFITLLGGAAAWPLAARAQQANRVRTIGVLLPLLPNDPFARIQVDAFLTALQQAGWTVWGDSSGVAVFEG